MARTLEESGARERRKRHHFSCAWETIIELPGTALNGQNLVKCLNSSHESRITEQLRNSQVKLQEESYK